MLTVGSFSLGIARHPFRDSLLPSDDAPRTISANVFTIRPFLSWMAGMAAIVQAPVGGMAYELLKTCNCLSRSAKFDNEEIKETQIPANTCTQIINELVS